LRVLQERELERVGGNRTIKVDVRVIATTNRHLEESVERKEFRQDLYFRLNVVPICVSPLRDHREDVSLLADQFRQRFARKHGVEVHGISNTCMKALENHSWPGNVRELQNVIERAVILCSEGSALETEHLGLAQKSAPVSAGHSDEFCTLSQLEKRHILAALAHTAWVIEGVKGAAAILKVHPNTLRSRLEKLGIKRSSHDRS